MADLESRGWPFADCAIHVQFRGDDNKRFSIDEIRQACEHFGRVLKIYTWMAKRSQKPQACVLFDSVDAVGLADRSTHGNMCRLWKTGYHMLRMCESTISILQKHLQDEGLTRDHPIFASIRTKHAPTPYQVHPAVRGIQLSDKQSRPIPTGPRFKPYSLEPRRGKSPPAFMSAPPPDTRPPNNSYVSFPPKRETMSPRAPTGPYAAKLSSFSPTRPGFAGRRSPSPMPPPKPTVLSPGPGDAGPSHTAHVDSLQQTQINRKLQTDIQELVSAQIDSVAKVQEVEEENQRLKARLRTREEEFALLEDTVKRVEQREQAAIALLSDAEAVHNATKKAYARDQEEMLSLRHSYRALESAKTKAEAELEALREKFGKLEAQLLRAQEQLRSSSLSKRSGELSMHSDSPRLETDVSSVEQDDICVTPATTVDFVRPGLEKATLQNLPSLLDAFKDIDDLVRSAFRP